jgi:hypothetical protein
MIRIFLLCLFTSVLFCQQQVDIPWPSLADSPWPTTRGDGQATGRSKYIGPRNANYVVKKDMPLGISFGPVIGYDDILFTGSASLNTVPYNRFYSLTPYLDTIWTFITPSSWPNKTGPALGADSTIYFSSNGGSIYALDYSGKLKWKKEGITYGGYPMISIAKNGNLYLSARNRFLLLDKGGNTIKDTLMSNFAPRVFLFSVGGDTVYFLNSDNNNNISLKAADLNLNVYWSINLTNIAPFGVPVIDNSNKIYLYTRDSLLNRYIRCYLPDGNIGWQYRIGSFGDFSSPSIDYGGNIILAVKSESLGIEVISLDYYGNENWITSIRLDQALADGSIITDAERKIYTVTEGYNGESYLHCLDSNGDILWEVFAENHSYIGSPAINSEGTIYIGGYNSSFNPYHTKNLIAVSEHPLDVVIDDNIMTDFELLQNYPNPFNLFTKIKYSIPQPSYVVLKLYDILGNEIGTLVSEEKLSGVYEVEFNASNLSSGIYFYQLLAGGFLSTKKLVLLK